MPTLRKWSFAALRRIGWPRNWPLPRIAGIPRPNRSSGHRTGGFESTAEKAVEGDLVMATLRKWSFAALRRIDWPRNWRFHRTGGLERVRLKKPLKVTWSPTLRKWSFAALRRIGWPGNWPLPRIAGIPRPNRSSGHRTGGLESTAEKAVEGDLVMPTLRKWSFTALRRIDWPRSWTLPRFSGDTKTE